MSGKGVFGRWGSCGEEKVGTGFDGTRETAVPCLRFELARLLMRGRSIARFAFAQCYRKSRKIRYHYCRGRTDKTRKREVMEELGCTLATRACTSRRRSVPGAGGGLGCGSLCCETGLKISGRKGRVCLVKTTELRSRGRGRAMPCLRLFMEISSSGDLGLPRIG